MRQPFRVLATAALFGLAGLAAVVWLWVGDKPASSQPATGEPDEQRLAEDDVDAGRADVGLQFDPETDGPGLYFVDPDGEPVAVDATVSAPGTYPPVEESPEAGEMLELPEPEGVTFWGDEPGTFEVAARSSEDDLGYWGDVSVEDFEEEERVRPIELTEASPLRVRVVDEAGEPVEGASVRLARGMVGLLQLAYEADEEGLVDFGAVPRGDYRLSAQAPGYVSQTRHLLHTDSEETIELQLGDGATVTGRVVDPSGVPVADATVEVVPVNRFDDEEEIDPDFLARMGSIQQVAETDQRGDFAVGGIGADAVRIRASAKGFAPALSETVRLAGEGSADVGELQLAPGHAVEVTVVDQEDDPVDEATVRWTSATSGTSDSALTDADGRVLFESVPAMARFEARMGEWN
ncbi:MAG: carboxypeptidase regulatory-like domain-containing protein, partial [Persicimonas sp.]